MTYLAHALVEPLLELFALICILDQGGHWLMSMLWLLEKLSRRVRSSVVTVLRPPSCAGSKYRVQGGETNEDERRGCLCRAQRQVLLSVA